MRGYGSPISLMLCIVRKSLFILSCRGVQRYATGIGALSICLIAMLSSLSSDEEDVGSSISQGWNGTRSALQIVLSSGRVPCWKYARMVFTVHFEGVEWEVC